MSSWEDFDDWPSSGGVGRNIPVEIVQKQTPPAQRYWVEEKDTGDENMPPVWSPVKRSAPEIPTNKLRRSRSCDSLSDSTSSPSPSVSRSRSRRNSTGPTVEERMKILEERLSLYGLKEKTKISGDGNCQFASVADQLFSDISKATKVR